MRAEIEIIGESELYSLPKDPKTVKIKTRFGYPSDLISIGTLGGKGVVSSKA